MGAIATQTIHGLSYVNVWWMRLGIAHQRIHPGRLHDNGAHERVHRTTKRRAIKPVQRTCASQQTVFHAFRTEYNTERPHEALQQETPATFYISASRPDPRTLPTLEYPLHFLAKKVTDAGTFRFQKRRLYIANSLVAQQNWTRGNGRRHLIDPTSTPFCLRPWMNGTTSSAGDTPPVLLMYLDDCVTHHPRCSLGAESIA
ncbi:MAG: integrase [Gemmatimonadetes bacterium]|nr:integrase [Gemmatimonadota bacterium]